MWWADGWRGGKGKGLRCIQTSAYGMAMDTQKMTIPHFGKLDNPPSYAVAVAQPDTIITRLPAAKMEIKVAVGDTIYVCKSGGHPRLIASGRWLQRADVMDLVFQNSQGKRLPATCRLELFAWPDRLSLMLEIIPNQPLSNASASILVNNVNATLPVGDWEKGRNQTLFATVFGDAQAKSTAALEVLDLSNNKPVEVTVEDAKGWTRVDIPNPPEYVKDEPSLQRFRVTAVNPSPQPQNLRINFSREESVTAMPGFVPMWRDSDGNPIPIPVQISKNWHTKKGVTTLYQGSWAHGLTMLSLPGSFKGSLEFCIARNFWGGVPLASHAQLCLIGWGTDQLWDEAAIGSWGESICYDPDVCLGRSMIDDIRPLMVTPMKTRDGKWGWTCNVGGGDFLVYEDGKKQRQPLVNMRTAYLSQGPNLTNVVYSGITADGVIAATLRVQTPRCDDINRAYHTLRYDVLKPTSFTRLAFYQLGADRYNEQRARKLARGNETGLLEEWAAPGKAGYQRRNGACPGTTPWFSLHEGVNKEELGAWANRGLILRAWKARLAGEPAAPTYASFGTQGGESNVELTPPAGVQTLKAGDFVEATVELVILPQFAKDYYGPNETLRQHLEKNQNTWKPVFRQATAGALDITVTKGRLLRAYPVEIALDESKKVEFGVTGGVGYAPVTFKGLDTYSGWTLQKQVGTTWRAVDQSVFGRDFWQVNPDQQGISMTFNIRLDANAGQQCYRLTQAE